jgi:hypothetical protein
LTRFPPSKACLREHVARANYQTKIWKIGNVAISELPNPWEGHGWLQNGEPLWCDTGIILPESLVDVLDKENNHEEDSDTDSDDDETRAQSFQYTANSESDESDSDEE